MRELLDVVYQAEELPLRIDLRSAAQREAAESFVVPNVGEDRLDRAESLRVVRSTIAPVLLGAGERLFEGTNLPALGYACTRRESSPDRKSVV